MKLLNPMYDFVFKAVFGSENKTSKELLINLLNDILDLKDKIKSIEYLNPFNNKESEKDKTSILDIRAKTNKNERINIEVQIKNEKYFRKRSLYYWAKTYTETIQEKQDYEELKKTIVINITDYNAITESDKLHTSFYLKEKEEGFILTEDIQIHFLEAPKLDKKKKISDMTKEELWLCFLKESSKENNEKALEELKKRGDAMKKAIEKLEKVSSDERMLEMYRDREKAKLDHLSSIRSAERRAEKRGEQRGEQRGIKRGAYDKAIETAKKMLKARLEIEQIAEFTDLPIEIIEKIKKEMKK